MLLRDGARVTRAGRANLPSGTQTVRVQGITNRAHDNSFRVSGRGPAVLTSIDVKRESKVIEDPERRPLLKKLEDLKKKRRELDDQMDILKTKLGAIEATTVEFLTTVGPQIATTNDVTMLQQFYSTYDEEYAKIQSQIRDLEEKIRDLDQEIAAIQKNLDEHGYEGTTIEYYIVDVQVEMKKQSELEIVIEYQLSDAWWEPAYDIDVLDDKAILKRLAVITNNSKEDWEDVQLVISTASAAPVALIEPEPLFIEDQAREGSGRPSGGYAGRVFRGGVDDIGQHPVGRESLAGVAVYELTQTFDIPSGKEQNPILLVEEEMESKTLHYWYAEEMDTVVAQNEVKNGDLVIIEGKARIFRHGEYLGQTYIPFVAPRETMKIGARAAHDIRAKKKLLNRHMEKAGITRGKARRQYKYELKIENFSNQEIDIEIIDRIPHSESEKIEVKIETDRLGLDEFRLGIMKWKRRIPAGGKETIEYEFEVVWDRNIRIDPPLP